MFLKAREQYEIFRKKNKKLADVAEFRIEECILGDSLEKHPLNVKITNVGAGINSIYDDYSPLISADGTEFIFTSNRKSEGSRQGSPVNYEDIYISKGHTDNWSKPQKISPNINIPYHDAAASMSPDGRTLFLYYEVGAGDIYVSNFDGNEWSPAKPLNKNINTTYWETSACISADGKKLYFTSNRPGGYGELDIYVSELTDKGDWGKAVNLGASINTHGHEDSPFIHADGKTLYFGSDGHVGLGEHDIFKSEFVDGKWQPAKNIGYPINTPEYESFFVISADNKVAYFSSSREDRIGNTDIYKVTFLDKPKPEHHVPTEPNHEEHKIVAHVDPIPVIEKEVVVATHSTHEVHKEIVVSNPVINPAVVTATATTAPLPEINPEHKDDHVEKHKQGDYVDPMVHHQKEIKNVTILKGKVIDANTTTPLGAHITLINNESNKVLVKVSSDPATGDFEIIIPHGGNYGVATELNGYLFNSINFDLPNFSEYMEIDTHILMQKAQVGSKVVLKNIFFDTGKADLKLQSLSELENIRELLANNPEMKVQINGHTDNVGKPSYNKALSLKRAQSVVTHLIHHGVDPSRLSAVGYGSERPLVSNDDETQGREINRRTEIEIIASVAK
jgi:outer membrane protein OmpA-like peptidoglycan-associated protein